MVGVEERFGQEKPTVARGESTGRKRGIRGGKDKDVKVMGLNWV